MNIRFKKDFNNKFDITALLKEIHKIKRFPNDSKNRFEFGFNVSFRSNDVVFIDWAKYDKINSMLKSIIDFKTNISSFSKDQIIKQTLNVVALEDIINADAFIKEINTQYKRYYKGKRNQKYYLLVTMSIDKLPFSSIAINDSTLYFYKEFPEKYQNARLKQFEEHFGKKEKSNWTKVVVSIEERDFHDAFLKTLSNLEIFRALLCLQITSWRFPLTTKPINQIVLGDFLTLHDSKGRCCNDDFYWYEPIIKKVSIHNFETDELTLIDKQTRKLVSKFRGCSLEHKKTISKALNQYVNAFDLINKESCFLKGWTSLENLLNTHKNDDLIRRSIAGYKRTEFLLLEIETLRTYRNELVHDLKVGGNDDSELLSYCYILLRFIRHQVSFNLNLSGKVKCIADYAKYLDYLSDKESLKKREIKYKRF